MRGAANAQYLADNRSSTSNDFEAFPDAKLTYEAWDRFVILLPEEKGEASKIVLRRRGIGWKLTNMVICSGAWDL
jgi:hypothetical protein